LVLSFDRPPSGLKFPNFPKFYCVLKIFVGTIVIENAECWAHNTLVKGNLCRYFPNFHKFIPEFILNFPNFWQKKILNSSMNNIATLAPICGELKSEKLQ